MTVGKLVWAIAIGVFLGLSVFTLAMTMAFTMKAQQAIIDEVSMKS